MRVCGREVERVVRGPGQSTMTIHAGVLRRSPQPMPWNDSQKRIEAPLQRLS